MTQKKNLYEYDAKAVIATAVIVSLMFIAAMIYNKDGYFKHRTPQKTEKEWPSIKPANIKTFVAKDMFGRIPR